MSTRIAVVGIVIESLDNIKEVNSILSERQINCWKNGVTIQRKEH